MGYYIETGSTRGKADALKKLGGEVLTGKPPKLSDIPDDKALIVVTDNHGTFETAGLAFDEAEFNAITRPDGRIRQFVLMDKAQAHRLAKYNPKNGKEQA